MLPFSLIPVAVVGATSFYDTFVDVGCSLRASPCSCSLPDLDHLCHWLLERWVCWHRPGRPLYHSARPLVELPPPRGLEQPARPTARLCRYLCLRMRRWYYRALDESGILCWAYSSGGRRGHRDIPWFHHCSVGVCALPATGDAAGEETRQRWCSSLMKLLESIVSDEIVIDE